MIISLRGASGSGKSTLVRRITSHCEGDGVPVFTEGRRKAYYTRHVLPDGRTLIVPGHYDIPNGGVDTLGSISEAYEIAMRADDEGHHVLMEGKCMSDGQTRAIGLHARGYDIRIVHVHEPLRKCVGSVRQRGHSIAEHSIRRTYDKVLRDVEAFRDARMPHVFQGRRHECLEKVKEWLGIDRS